MKNVRVENETSDNVKVWNLFFWFVFFMLLDLLFVSISKPKNTPVVHDLPKNKPKCNNHCVFKMPFFRFSFAYKESDDYVAEEN